MKLLKKILTMIVILLLILSFKTELRAETNAETNNTVITLQASSKTIEKDVPIQVDVFIKNDNAKVYSLDCFIDLNKDVFYDIDQNSFEEKIQMNSLVYLPEDGNLILVLNEAINEGIVATITLVPKVSLTGNENIDLIKFCDMQTVTEDFVQEYANEEKTAVITLRDELYLSSDTYKIGDNDIENYEDGDLYISRVVYNTTKEEFISNLDTNGDIIILKPDGTELQDGELVGTGMTLNVTKDTDVIDLQIAVMGDLDGNGKVTPTDLSAMNHVILKTVTLENEYFIAADMDENGKVSATDLSEENRIIINRL